MAVDTLQIVYMYTSPVEQFEEEYDNFDAFVRGHIRYKSICEVLKKHNRIDTTVEFTERTYPFSEKVHFKRNGTVTIG